MPITSRVTSTLVAIALFLLVLTVSGPSVVATSSEPHWNQASITMPAPGWTYVLIYNQSNGIIVGGDACIDTGGSVNPCNDLLAPNQSLLNITGDNQIIANIWMKDELSCYQVNLTNHAIEHIPGCSLATLDLNTTTTLSTETTTQNNLQSSLAMLNPTAALIVFSTAGGILLVMKGRRLIHFLMLRRKS